MDAKLRSTISKIQQDRGKGNQPRALKRLADAVKNYPEAVELYHEAVEACVEAGESLGAIEYLKGALSRFPAEHDGLLALARDRASARGDAVVGKFLIEHSVKRRDLLGALTTSGAFQDRTVRDLVQRSRMKRNTLTSAARGGHSVSDELITNMMSEVVMNTRLGRTNDAAGVVTEILDANAGDDGIIGALETFLEGLGESASRSAPTLIARARCAILSSRHIEAAEKLVAAVEIDCAHGPAALDLLRDVGDQFDEVPEFVEDAVVEILLITGAHDRATELLLPRFEAHPGDNAAKIVDRVGRHLKASGEVTGLHTLFLDAAVEVDRMDRVFDTLEALAQSAENRAGLLEWLDDPARTRFLSSEILTLHARLAIENDDFDGAAQILRALCACSNEAIPSVLKVLERSRSRDAALEDLFVELSGSLPPPTEDAGGLAAAGDASPQHASTDAAGLGLEHFENREFRFSSDDAGDESVVNIVAEDAEPPALGAAGNGDESPRELDDFDICDGINILGAQEDSTAASARPVVSGGAGGAGGRRPLDTGKAGIIWDEEGEDTPSPPPVAKSSGVHIPEDHIRNVAGALYASGARTFFYIEDDAPSPEPTPPSTEAPVAAPEHDSEAPAVVLAGPPEPAPVLSFDEKFALFQDGTLAPDAIVELMEEAVGRHDIGVLERLLENTPRDGEYEARLGLCAVECHLMNARPRDGLEALRRLRGADLSEEQRKSIWMKMVECQRMLHDYDAAHLTLVELVKLYPDCPEVDRLAKQNYREYLANHCTDAPVLEKVTSLDGDS